MGLINVRLDDIKEPEIVPEGEYDLRIVKADDGESKSGKPMTTVVIRIEDSGIRNPAPVMHYILPPQPDTPQQQIDMRLLEIKRFLECFHIPYDESGFNTEDMVGATGRSLLVQEEGDDDIVRNKLKLPRLKR